jgi:hypothetical protein
MKAAKKKNAIRPWRQDFRDLASLPDTKVVRTHFLLNLLSTLFLTLALGLFLYQEYVIGTRRSEVALVRDSISTAASSDRRNQEASARFNRTAAKVGEAAKFAATAIRPEVLVAQLARVKIPEARFNSLEYTRLSGNSSPDRHVSGFYRQGRLAADAGTAGKIFKNAAYSRIVINGTMSPSAGSSAPALIDSLVGRIRDAEFWGDVPHGVDLDGSTPSRDMSTFDYSLIVEWVSTQERQK